MIYRERSKTSSHVTERKFTINDLKFSSPNVQIAQLFRFSSPLAPFFSRAKSQEIIKLCEITHTRGLGLATRVKTRLIQFF